MAKRKKTKAQKPSVPGPATLPSLHPLLSPLVAYAFETLRTNAAFRDQTQWYPIHISSEPLIWLELYYGREKERQVYNDQAFSRAHREGKLIRGTHGGFTDFFVPIMVDGAAQAVLITGPIAAARPTGPELLDRWRWLSGRHGQSSDSEFVEFVSISLDALHFDREQMLAFERLLECFALLCAGQGNAHALSTEAGGLIAKVEQARYVDKMWGSVRTMVDERSARGWLSSYRANELRDLGLSGVPEHAVVGFMTSDRDAPDDVEQMLARDAFQRACVDLARAAKDVACGRVGEHGVVFLLSNVGSPARLRHFVTDLGNRVSALARKRFGFTLHLGASVEGPTLPLSARYEQALGAAENALSRGISFTMAEPDLLRAMTPVRRLREQLGLVSQERSSVLITRFERYVDAVAAACGQRMEAFRAHLDAGFDRALQALRHTGALEQRSQLEMYEALDRAARDAATVDALVAAYRRAIADLVDAAERPVAAAQDRSLRRALAYIDRHFTEPLSFSNVARVAGFAPRHFSRLFKQQQAVTFEEYIRRLRVERAKQLLEDTDLSVERVAQLSGFTLRPYFHRVFKEALGATPLEFRNAKR